MKMYLFLILGVTSSLFLADCNMLFDKDLIVVETSLNESLQNNDVKIREKRVAGMPEALIIKSDGTKVYVNFQNSPYKRVPRDIKYLLSSNWLTQFVPAVYTVVFCFSLPLNIGAVLIFLLKIKVKKPAVVYMLNLSIADLFFVCMLPFNIVYRFSGNNWKAGTALCHIAISAFYFNMYCSILLITSMSVDKFLALVYPIQSLSWRSLTRAWIICFFIWVISIASTVPLLITQQTFYIDQMGITTCHDVRNQNEVGNFYMYYFSTFTSVFFFIPLIITAVCYAITIHRLSSSTMGNTDRKKQAVSSAIVVLCIFVICFMPTNLVFFVHNLQVGGVPAIQLYLGYLICTSISSISTTLNPLLYFVASSKFQSVLCCRKDDTSVKERESSTKL